MAIQGRLPFGSGGGGALAGPGGLQASYARAYQDALDMNKTGYENILAGYQQLGDAQTADQQKITPGYEQLMSGVLGTIDTMGGSQRTAIADQYAKASGAATQQLVNSGLANSTVASSVQRGLTLDRAKAENDLADRLAGTKAGYMANLGQAGLSYQERALADRTALGQNQLGFMNSVSAAYPDAGAYQQLAQMYGQMEASKSSGGGGAMTTGVPSVGGGVTKGGHQFAPNSNVDWNAGATPPVQVAGGGGTARAPDGTPLVAQPLMSGPAYGVAALGGAAGLAGLMAPKPAAKNYADMTEDEQVAFDEAEAAAAQAGDLASAYGSNLYGDFF